MANKKQLIDLDKLTETLKATSLKDCFPDWDDMLPQAKVAAFRMLRAYREIVLNQSTVDAVKVCRCKDCKHMEITPDNLRWCNVWNGINGMGDCGYCNYGERRCE